MVLRSDYWQICRRWLLFLSGPSRLQTLNWSSVTSSVWGAKKKNDWFLSVDQTQFRATFFTQTVAPCSVELSDDEGDDELEGEDENYICTLLDEDGWECGPRWPTARALAAHQRHTQGGTAWRTQGSGKPGGHKSVLLVRIDTCQY